jgi:hypothetical protein
MTTNERILELAGVKTGTALTEGKGDKVDGMFDELLGVWKKYKEPELQQAVKKAMRKAYQQGTRDGETDTLLGPRH